MTLIAIHTTPQRVQIMTDTWSYRDSGQSLGHTTKVTGFAHLNAAVMTQGACEFADRWATHLHRAATSSTSFDDLLVNHAQDSIARAWNEALDGRDRGNQTHGTDYDLADTTAFVVGYSDHEQRYLAVGFSSLMDFLPFELEDTFVIPAPFDTAPPAFELMRAERFMAKRPTDQDASALHTWQHKPPMTPPVTDDAWRDLAVKIRQHRAMAEEGTRMKVFVGGTAWLTTLTPGHHEHRAIHTFNDAGDELTTIMRGTLHPLGQLGACPCGTGQRFLDCCLVEHLDQHCLCGSTRNLRDCCAVPEARAQVNA